MPEKMFREKDKFLICKNCQTEVSIGFNILQQPCFEKYADECVENSLCPKCLIKHRIEGIVKNDTVLLETAKNMICVGAI